MVLLATEAGELIITTLDGAEIARHHLVAGHHERVVIAAHYASLKPPARARPATGARQVVPDDTGRGLPDAPVVAQRALAEYAALAEVAG